MVKHINASELEKLLQTEQKTVFCDFWATWCGPCRMLAPVFEELSEEYADKAVFVKMDVDDAECESAAKKYQISSIPNILAFKDGKMVANNLGFVPKQMLENFIKNNL